MTVYEKIMKMSKPAYFVLIDPDKRGVEDSLRLAAAAEKCGVDALLVGSSILLDDVLDEYIVSIKKETGIPVIIFPGLLNTISPNADALLFLSMISSRNPQLLIGEQVRAAPYIKKKNIETISTAYLLIESGNLTSVQYMSNSFPIPSGKPDIVVAHSLAAEYIGMKLIYLEAGSGAANPVPDEIISRVKDSCILPIIVGGGITTPQTALQKAKAGADIIVTGTVLEKDKGTDKMFAIAESIHSLR